MQNNQTFNQKIEAILKKRLDLENQELNLKSNLSSDLNLSELEKQDLISSLETELNFTIEDRSKLNSVETLEDLIHLIEENSNEF